MHQQYVQQTLWFFMILLHTTSAVTVAATLAGTVTDAGQSSVKDAVVWAESTGPIASFPPPQQHAEMAQVNLAFTPPVLPVLVGTTVDFPNRDNVYHSVFSFSRRQRFEIGLYPPGMSRSVTFDRVGQVKLFCNIHDHMYGAILVLPTPYFSITAAEGAFTIIGVPAGDYTVNVWHERLQGTPQTVSVKDDDTADLAFSLRPQHHSRRSK
jgi:plastocyanin